MDSIIERKEPARPSLRAFLELAFRPLYLAGTAWALIAVGIWIYAPQVLTAPLQGVAWNAHEMLWSFVVTIAAAFLMKAGATWIGVNPLKSWALATACVLWLVARFGFLTGGNELFWIAMAAVAGLKIPMQTRTGQVQLAACAAAIVFLLAGLQRPTAVALGLAGALSLLQVVTWKPYAVRCNPLLWILYAGHAGLGIGLLMAACTAAGVDLPPALPAHMIAMAGFSVLIIGMVTRTAPGHLGRPLAADRSMLVSYVLMLIAVALRLAALAPSAFSLLALQLSAAAWIAALALYLWRFTPLMIRPRQ